MSALVGYGASDSDSDSDSGPDSDSTTAQPPKARSHHHQQEEQEEEEQQQQQQSEAIHSSTAKQHIPIQTQIQTPELLRPRPITTTNALSSRPLSKPPTAAAAEDLPQASISQPPHRRLHPGSDSGPDPPTDAALSSSTQSTQTTQTTQTSLHNLTLPPIPNLDIPSSPPGSPDATSSSKVSQFLALKEQQGVHFHARLAGSVAVRNPALLGRLVEGAGVRVEELYGSSLPAEVWDPAGLVGVEVERGRGRKGGVEFVGGRRE